MGIDIYLSWDGQTEEDKQKMFSARRTGQFGYLRESYHGGPYATQVVFRDAFDAEDATAAIPAALMKERMQSVTEPANQQECNKGHLISMVMSRVFASQEGEVGKHNLSEEEAEEAEKSGTAAEIIKRKLAGIDMEAVVGELQKKVGNVTAPMTGEEAITERLTNSYGASKSEIDEEIANFYAFIALAEKKELEHGKPCTVYASY